MKKRWRRDKHSYSRAKAGINYARHAGTSERDRNTDKLTLAHILKHTTFALVNSIRTMVIQQPLTVRPVEYRYSSSKAAHKCMSALVTLVNSICLCELFMFSNESTVIEVALSEQW